MQLQTQSQAHVYSLFTCSDKADLGVRIPKRAGNLFPGFLPSPDVAEGETAGRHASLQMQNYANAWTET